jgi:drug/metabolite transporter (DMT)-like permease
LALIAAMTWGLYSNLARRWAGHSQAGAVPWFLLATGLVLVIGAVLFEPLPTGRLRPRGAVELLYLAIGPTLLAYMFWDFGIRKGNIVAISSVSFLTPLISSAINCVYLGVSPGASLWLACGLVILGALVCKWSIRDEPDGSQDPQPP